MVSYQPKTAPAKRIEEMIYLIRGQRVMLDFDLARIYGVSTMRLNEQIKRNAGRFPPDFAFQLVRQEFRSLISQMAISSLHGGRRKLPRVFTEHGALMLASVLKSPMAIEASVRVVRAFVLMREQLAAHKELAGKLADLERRVSGHDTAIQDLFEAIRQLVEPPLPENRREIGFHVRETAPLYRVGRRCRR
ncbi:MAG TPA: ORF6N domain-containing protein [Candidatus Acidoferrum sp.]|nr:ORF6N domain-containing protein [Candidatus Acidoferrum sp.]